MSVIDSNTGISLSNLTPELKAKNTLKEDNASNTEDSSGIDKNKAPTAVIGNIINQEQKVVQEPLTPQQLEDVAQQLQDFVGEMNRGLEFSVDKDSGRDVIKVIDKDSGDLVKQYPSEEVLTLVAKLSDMVGGFIDAKV